MSQPISPVPGIEPKRLARAVHLDCEPLGDGRWRVTGGARDHLVGPGDACDCTDFGLHHALCKHLARVELEALPPQLLTALRTVVPLPKRLRRRQTVETP